MNENEKSALDERKKSALLRYVAIMFAVAFVLVLFSLLGQMRNSMSTISQLNQSSNSALQKAEQLQEHNHELELENQELSLELEDLKKAHAELEAEIAEQKKQLNAAAGEKEEIEQQYDALRQELDQLEQTYALQSDEYRQTVQAYELLLELQSTVTPGDQTGNDAAEKLIAELKKLESYLGDTARKTFENLSSRGE